MHFVAWHYLVDYDLLRIAVGNALHSVLSGGLDIKVIGPNKMTHSDAVSRYAADVSYYESMSVDGGWRTGIALAPTDRESRSMAKIDDQPRAAREPPVRDCPQDCRKDRPGYLRDHYPVDCHSEFLQPFLAAGHGYIWRCTVPHAALPYLQAAAQVQRGIANMDGLGHSGSSARAAAA